nr:unnamed protein product [Callosobruchus chinensis]
MPVIKLKNYPKKLSGKGLSKAKDGKEEKTEIVTVEEQGKELQTTVTVYTADEVEYPKPTYPVIELPEEVKEEEVLTRVVKKRVIKKQEGDKQEKTEIVTIEEEGKKPETTVTVQEIFQPEEIDYPNASIPRGRASGEVKVEEIITPEGTKKKQVIKKRVIKKKKDGKEENTEIVTADEIKYQKPSYTIVELPEEIKERKLKELSRNG